MTKLIDAFQYLQNAHTTNHVTQPSSHATIKVSAILFHIATLIVIGFKQINQITYVLDNTNSLIAIRFIHNEQVRVNIDYSAFKDGKYCSYDGAII